ncbi:MAG: hypothetical protein IID36_08390 [Planctomycetes bacterium]|nr:hypothetical protein [Planctomycetota bacterium]
MGTGRSPSTIRIVSSLAGEPAKRKPPSGGGRLVALERRPPAAAELAVLRWTAVLALFVPILLALRGPTPLVFAATRVFRAVDFFVLGLPAVFFFAAILFAPPFLAVDCFFAAAFFTAIILPAILFPVGFFLATAFFAAGFFFAAAFFAAIFFPATFFALDFFVAAGVFADFFLERRVDVAPRTVRPRADEVFLVDLRFATTANGAPTNAE